MITLGSEHCICLSRARLAVREEADLLPLNCKGDNRLKLHENLLLSRGLAEDAIEFVKEVFFFTGADNGFEAELRLGYVAWILFGKLRLFG